MTEEDQIALTNATLLLRGIVKRKLLTEIGEAIIGDAVAELEETLERLEK